MPGAPGGGRAGPPRPMEPVFVPKAANLAGHQLTDLIARPLALRILRPDQPNRAADAVLARVARLTVFP